MKFTTLLILPLFALAGVNAIPSPNANADADAHAQAESPPYRPSCSQCSPFPPPGPQSCDITTSCVLNTAHTGPSPAPYYCACRAGYRASAAAADTSVQWRLPWPGQEYRVFVRPGIACDHLCDHWQLGPDSCQEVPVLKSCM